MDNSVPGYRSFERLYLILHETANWSVILPQGAVRCEPASLRMALDKATELALRGSEVDALVRSSSSEIVLFSDQVRKLMNYLAEHEPVPEPRTAAIANGGLGGIDDVRSLTSPNGTGYGDATVENAVSVK
jgi:hypothetical protein